MAFRTRAKARSRYGPLVSRPNPATQLPLRSLFSSFFFPSTREMNAKRRFNRQKYKAFSTAAVSFPSFRALAMEMLKCIDISINAKFPVCPSASRGSKQYCWFRWAGAPVGWVQLSAAMGRKKRKNTRHEGGGGAASGAGLAPSSSRARLATNAPANGAVAAVGGENEAGIDGLSRADLVSLCRVLKGIGAHRDAPSWRVPALKPLRKSLHPLVTALVGIYKDRGGVAGKRERKRHKLEKGAGADAERGAGTAEPAAAAGSPSSAPAVTSVVGSQLFPRALHALERINGAQPSAPLTTSADTLLLLHRDLKPLRVVLHPFIESCIDEQQGSWTARASSALLDGRMADACEALTAIKRRGKLPKLGAVQVRCSRE